MRTSGGGSSRAISKTCSRGGGGSNQWDDVTMSELIGPIVGAVGIVVGLVSGLVTLGLKRELKARDDAEKRQREDLEKAVKALEKTTDEIKQAHETERKERNEKNESLFRAQKDLGREISALATTVSGHGKECQGTFLSRSEFDRVEKFREQQEKLKAAQDERLENNMRSLQSTLQSMIQNLSLRR